MSYPEIPYKPAVERESRYLPVWISTPAQRYRMVLIVGMAAFLLWILTQAWAAMLPFFLGIILAYLLVPVVDFFDEHAPPFLRGTAWSRPLAILLVYLIGVGFVAGLLAYFIPAFTNQTEQFAQVIPSYVDRISNLLTLDFQGLFDWVPPEIQDAVQQNIQTAIGTLTDALRRGVGGTLRTLWETLSFIIGMIIVPVWLFYVLNDKEKIKRAFYRLIPDKAVDDVRHIILIVDSLLSSYVRGQLLLGLIVGLMATLALVGLGVDLALLLGTFAGLFELVPILGPFLGAVPAVIIAFLQQPILALWVALTYLGIQQIENTLLVPRISGNAVGFHPAAIMILVVVGSEVAGFLGLLLAVPVAAVIRDIYQYLYLRTTERGATPEMAMETLRARSL